MIKRPNAENVNALRVPALAPRTMTVAEKTDCSTHRVIFQAHLFKVPAQDLTYGGIDPGPAGFHWVEIEFRQND